MSEFQPTPRTSLGRLPKRGSYDRETIRSILSEGLICHIAYSLGGKPFVIPTGYAADPDWLYLHGSQKNRTLRAALDGEVAVSVTLLDGIVLARSAFHHSFNYRSVIIYGKGEEVVDRDEKLRIFKLLVEHIVPGRWAVARQPNQAEIEATLVVRIPIEECSAKLRKGGPVDDAEDLQWPVWAGVLPARTSWGPPAPAPETAAAAAPPSYLIDYSRGAR